MRLWATGQADHSADRVTGGEFCTAPGSQSYRTDVARAERRRAGIVRRSSVLGSSMTVSGTVAPGFEPVREAFERNFAEHGDVGAAVAVYRHGRPVVDLWGGLADPETDRPWERDTAAL